MKNVLGFYVKKSYLTTRAAGYILQMKLKNAYQLKQYIKLEIVAVLIKISNPVG